MINDKNNVKDDIWYHVSNEDFENIEIDKCIQGFWLTKNLNSIVNGETGASIKSDNVIIHKFSANKLDRIGGWEEYEEHLADQLILYGLDGVLLDDDLLVYNVEKLEKLEKISLNLNNEEEISQLLSANKKSKLKIK